MPSPPQPIRRLQRSRHCKRRAQAGCIIIRENAAGFSYSQFSERAVANRKLMQADVRNSTSRIELVPDGFASISFELTSSVL